MLLSATLVSFAIVIPPHEPVLEPHPGALQLSDTGALQLSDTGELVLEGGVRSDVRDVIALPEGAWDSFRGATRACSWRSTAAQAKYFYTPSSRPWESGLQSKSDLPVWSCETPADESSTWLALRVGPIHSTGGSDWHAVFGVEWPDVASLLADNPFFEVRAASILAASAEGDVLQFPAMHYHHSHIWHNSSEGVVLSKDTMDDWWDDANRFFADVNVSPDHILPYEQDRICATDERYQCMLTRFPDGHGLVLNGAVGFDVLLNDLRDANSSKETWFVEVAIQVVRSTSRTLRGLDMWIGAHWAAFNKPPYDFVRARDSNPRPPKGARFHGRRFETHSRSTRGRCPLAWRVSCGRMSCRPCPAPSKPCGCTLTRGSATASPGSSTVRPRTSAWASRHSPPSHIAYPLCPPTVD